VIRLIVGVLILVVLAVMFAMNGGNSTPLNLFGYRLESVPVIAVAVAGFVLGVLYSFILYFLRFLDRRRRASLKDRDRSVRGREQALQDKEKRLETLAEGLQDVSQPADGASEREGEASADRSRRRRSR